MSSEMWHMRCAANAMCMNGGECTSDDGHKCVCPAYFEGEYCEIDITELGARRSSFAVGFILFFVMALFIVFVVYACRQRKLNRYLRVAR